MCRGVATRSLWRCGLQGPNKNRIFLGTNIPGMRSALGASLHAVQTGDVSASPDHAVSSEGGPRGPRTFLTLAANIR